MNSNWRFFRAGGFDQVRLETADELLAIGELDQKLWVALSCPTTGIEFDARTLALIDRDADGQVRAAELIAAVQWAGARLKDRQVLVQGLGGVPLSAIRDDDELGQRIVNAARVLLAELDSTSNLITVAAASAEQQRFYQRALSAWQSSGAPALLLGDATDAAYAALLAVQTKIDDWFVRSSLAAFDERAGAAMNASGETYAALSATPLTQDALGVAALPIAQVTSQAQFALQSGINPAWLARIEQFNRQVISPMLGTREHLCVDDWQAIKERFAPYQQWLVSKPDAAAKDAGVHELEMLARYVRDLLLLANNFVAFRDFYARQGSATFQLGTLYLDARSCELCVAVSDPARHTAMASLSRICLVYLDCVRGADKLSIAAAFTAGDSDQLMVGRNGVFYDRQGRDWNATISKIIAQPISLRQAFWAPYKRFGRLVSEQMQKLAASRAKQSDDRMSALAQDATKKPAPAGKTPQTPAAAAFDVGKFAGIFAAIGLAVGALGTALASILMGLLSLKWWQIPLALAGMVLLISGPAVLLAWFKLRSRNLGPLLDANGWAINARARINIPFGTSLTHLAQLPPNAERSLTDPYAERKTPWPVYLLLAILILGSGLAIRYL